MEGMQNPYYPFPMAPVVKSPSSLARDLVSMLPAGTQIGVSLPVGERTLNLSVGVGARQNAPRQHAQDGRTLLEMFPPAFLGGAPQD